MISYNSNRCNDNLHNRHIIKQQFIVLIDIELTSRELDGLVN